MRRRPPRMRRRNGFKNRLPFFTSSVNGSPGCHLKRDSQYRNAKRPRFRKRPKRNREIIFTIRFHRIMQSQIPENEAPSNPSWIGPASGRRSRCACSRPKAATNFAFIDVDLFANRRRIRDAAGFRGDLVECGLTLRIEIVFWHGARNLAPFENTAPFSCFLAAALVLKCLVSSLPVSDFFFREYNR